MPGACSTVGLGWRAGRSLRCRPRAVLLCGSEFRSDLQYVPAACIVGAQHGQGMHRSNAAPACSTMARSSTTENLRLALRGDYVVRTAKLSTQSVPAWCKG